MDPLNPPVMTWDG